MSILIKNMEMPKCCDVCQFCAWSSFHQTAACEVHDNEPCFDDFSVEYRKKRSNICPLVKFSKNEDAISRQGAIDVAFDIFPDDEYFREQFVKSIEALPSTQPENIRCKDCKYAINNGTSEMMCKNSRTRVVDTNNNFGCIFAERRTNE